MRDEQAEGHTGASVVREDDLIGQDPLASGTEHKPGAPSGVMDDTTQSSQRRIGFFTPLRRSSMRLLLAGQTISRLGDQVYFVALPWLVLRVINAPLALSLVLGTSAVALGVCTLVGGVLADRYGPRALMLGADVLRFLVMAVLAACVLLFVPPLWLLIVLAALLGIGSGLFYPASAAIIPFLVPEEELQPANSFDQLALQTSNFVGPSIGGAVLAVTQLALGFVIDAVSFAVSVLTLFAIRMPPRTTAPSSAAGATAAKQVGGLAALGEAIGFLRKTPFLSTLLGLSLLGNFAINGLVDVATPLLLKQWVGLSEGPRALGIVIGGFGLGSIVGAVIAGLATRLQHKPLVAVLLIVPVAGLVAWMPFTGSVLPLAVAYASVGVLVAISNVLFITVIQRLIPMAMMGRMMSLALFGTFAGTPLSIFAYGAAASVVPAIAYLFVAGGVLIGAGCLLALTRKVIWQTP